MTSISMSLKQYPLGNILSKMTLMKLPQTSLFYSRLAISALVSVIVSFAPPLAGDSLEVRSKIFASNTPTLFYVEDAEQLFLAHGRILQAQGHDSCAHSFRSGYRRRRCCVDAMTTYFVGS